MTAADHHPAAAVIPYWLGRPALEALEVAHAAEAAGIGALWLGEMLSFDAFALAGALARETSLHLTVGPLAVGVRTPVGIAMGVASLQALAGPERVAVALGASTRAVTAEWHGRDWTRTPARIAETADVVRRVLAGERTGHHGVLASEGFRLGMGASEVEVAVAAFGRRSLQVADETADRLVVNLVTPAQAGRLAEAVPGRPVTAWVVGAVDPSPEAVERIRRQVSLYLAAPGYGDMFTEAGFGEVVDEARAGRPPSELTVPDALLHAVAAIGSADDVRESLDAYRAVGVTQVAVVPATDGDPGGARTFAAVA
jgi:probable F420-dependent oxidoreductase